jgi:hypothetical protein
LRNILSLLNFNLTYVDTVEDTETDANDDDSAKVCSGNSAETLRRSGAKILPIDVCWLGGTLIGVSIRTTRTATTDTVKECANHRSSLGLDNKGLILLSLKNNDANAQEEFFLLAWNEIISEFSHLLESISHISFNDL